MQEVKFVGSKTFITKKETEDFSQIIIEGENEVFHGQPLGGTMDEDNKPHSSEEKPVGDFKYLIKNILKTKICTYFKL